MKLFSAVRRSVLGLIVVMSFAASACAASDMYLKIEGIEGESSLSEGAIDVLAHSYDVATPRDAASGLPTGRRQHKPVSGPPDRPPTMSDLVVSCVIDKSTPLLMKACVQGETVGSAVLSCRKTGGDGTPYMVITMSDCIVSSISSSPTSSDEAPAVTVALAFKNISIEFPSSKVPGVNWIRRFDNFLTTPPSPR